MRPAARILVVVALTAVAAGAYLYLRPLPVPEAQATQVSAEPDGELVTGKTQPAPGRSARIAPAVLHPVVEVLVKAGDRVKKDQRLVVLDEDEPKADVASKKAALDAARATLARLKAEPREEEIKEATASLHVAQITLEEARRYLQRITPGWEHGVVPEQRYHEARVHVSKSEAEQRAAAARLHKLHKRAFAQELAEMEAKVAEAAANVRGAEAELEHYTVVAPIDGVVSWLDVNLGTVARPGTTVWGEILDLSELDVRCEVPPRRADGLGIGETADVVDEGRGLRLRGKIVLVGIAADPSTGRVPVLVRLANRDGRLRCHVEVKVRLPVGKPQAAGR
jgi:HlyD family secretion protein